MELKRWWDGKVIFTIVYCVCFVLYLFAVFWPVEAKSYAVSAHLLIPSIGLSSDVTTVDLADGELETPDTIVGSYVRSAHKNFLFGHSSTVFNKLHEVKTGDEIVYEDTKYKVISSEILEKNDINMNKLLRASERDTLVVMTCAGEDLGEGDATHRLILTAVRQ